MRTLRRITYAATAGLLAVAVATPASAQSATDTYAGEAEANALVITLGGEQVSVASTAAQNSSPSNAAAQGLGALVSTEAFGATEASVDGPGQSDGSPDPTCSELELPPEVPFVSLSAACSTAQAASGDTDSGSEATADGVVLDISGDEALQPLVDALNDLPLDEVTDPLCEGIGDLLGPILPVPCDLLVDQIVDVLEDALVGDVSLLTVDAGSTTSTTTTDATTVTASTTATGVTVTVLDGGLLGTPLLTIEAGATTTSVTRDRTTGETTAEETAVPGQISISPVLATVLGLPESSFELPSGERFDLPLPAPLESSIALSTGRTAEIEGGAIAEAAVVDIDLFSGIEGGIQVQVGDGFSSVVGADGEAPTPPTPPPGDDDPAPPAPGAPGAPPRTTLPRTGVEERSLQAIAVVLLASAAGIGAVVIRSTRRTRADQV